MNIEKVETKIRISAYSININDTFKCDQMVLSTIGMRDSIKNIFSSEK